MPAAELADRVLPLLRKARVALWDDPDASARLSALLKAAEEPLAVHVDGPDADALAARLAEASPRWLRLVDHPDAAGARLVAGPLPAHADSATRALAADADDATWTRTLADLEGDAPAIKAVALLAGLREVAETGRPRTAAVAEASEEIELEDATARTLDARVRLRRGVEGLDAAEQADALALLDGTTTDAPADVARWRRVAADAGRPQLAREVAGVLARAAERLV